MNAKKRKQTVAIAGGVAAAVLLALFAFAGRAPLRKHVMAYRGISDARSGQILEELRRAGRVIRMTLSDVPHEGSWEPVLVVEWEGGATPPSAPELYHWAPEAPRI
jgi:hypothetical protein